MLVGRTVHSWNSKRRLPQLLGGYTTTRMRLFVPLGPVRGITGICIATNPSASVDPGGTIRMFAVDVTGSFVFLLKSAHSPTWEVIPLLHNSLRGAGNPFTLIDSSSMECSGGAALRSANLSRMPSGLTIRPEALRHDLRCQMK
jgi:hypothetical protein